MDRAEHLVQHSPLWQVPVHDLLHCTVSCTKCVLRDLEKLTDLVRRRCVLLTCSKSVNNLI